MLISFPARWVPVRGLEPFINFLWSNNNQYLINQEDSNQDQKGADSYYHAR